MTDLLKPAVPALSRADLAPLREAVDLPPAEFEKAVAPVFRKLLVKTLGNVPEGFTMKDLTAVAKLQRAYDGLDKKDSGGGPVGLVSFMRPVGQRRVGDTTRGVGGGGAVVELEVVSAGATADEDPFAV